MRHRLLARLRRLLETLESPEPLINFTGEDQVPRPPDASGQIRSARISFGLLTRRSNFARSWRISWQSTSHGVVKVSRGETGLCHFPAAPLAYGTQPRAVQR